MTKPLTAPKRALLNTELAKNSNVDLAVAQRPSRTEAGITPGAIINYGYNGPQVEVIGPGRGIGWIYIGWVDDDNVTTTMGQIHKDSLVAPPPPPVEPL